MANPIVQNLKTTAHYIVSEAADMYRSREQVIIATGSGKLLAGAVLEKSAGKYVPVSTPANAVAVLFEGCDATSADVRRTITARDTAVQVDVLVWPASFTDVQKTAALAALEARGIVGR